MTDVLASRTITMLQPPRIVIGSDALRQCTGDLLERRHGRVLFACSPSTRVFAEEIAASLRAEGVATRFDDSTQTCAQSQLKTPGKSTGGPGNPDR